MRRDHELSTHRIVSIALMGFLSSVLMLSEVNSFHAGVTSSSSSIGGWGLGADFKRITSTTLLSTRALTSNTSESTPDDDEGDSQSRGPANQASYETHKQSIPSQESSPSNACQQNSEPRILDKLSMPWSEVQGWALRDNLPRYTIVIPMESSRREDSALVFALWRTMLREVPELAGYPIDFLREKCDEMIARQETKIQVTPKLLPFLEDYIFASAGGVSGKVYGVPGLADGTRIETSAVTNVEVTLPQGFVRTSDGKAAYELGRPMREGVLEVSGLTKEPLSTAMTGPFEILKTVNNGVAGVTDGVGEDGDGMLVRLGVSTGILLAGATAINMLSHHLTVNVFWV
jgi:hypothetical protein